MAGLRLPIESHVLQAFVSESIKPFIDGVVTFGAGHFYISQSDKGGLVFGGDLDGYNSYAQRGKLPERASALLPAPELAGLPAVIDRVPFRIPIEPVAGALRYRTQLSPAGGFSVLASDRSGFHSSGAGGADCCARAGTSAGTRAGARRGWWCGRHAFHLALVRLPAGGL